MSQNRKCPYCGGELQESALFCPFCMQSLQNKKDVTPDLSKRRNRWKILALFMLVVVCLSLVCLLIHVLAGVFENMDSSSVSSQFDVRAKKTEEAQGNLEGTFGSLSQLPQSTPNQQSAQNRIPGAAAGTQAATERTEATANPSVDQTEPTVSVTTPPTSQPTTPTEPTTSTTTPTVPQCSHVYKAATCTTPMTCTKCGEIYGVADTQAHNWQAVTATVHYDEVGHYETVETGPVKKTMYRCFFCSYAQPAYDSLDAVREHMPVHSHYSAYEYMMSRPDLGSDTYETWVPVYEEKWIVDQQAYDETIITGYKCSICGQTK